MHTLDAPVSGQEEALSKAHASVGADDSPNLTELSKLKLLLDHAPATIFIADLRTFQLVFATGFAASRMGRSQENMVTAGPKLLQEILHPDDVSHTMEHMTRLRRSAPGQVLPNECRILHADGTYHWYETLDTVVLRDDSGEPTHFAGVSYDITERKQTESALRASEERLKAIIESTPNVAMQIYDIDGTVRYWNHASESLFGWSAEEAIGRTLASLIHTQEEELNFRTLLGEINQTGRVEGPSEFRFTRRDGTPGHCLSTIFRIPGEGDGPQFVCIDVDITDLKLAEENLRTTEGRFRALIDGAPNVAIQVYDLEGCIHHWNPATEKIFGYMAAQAIGQKLEDLYYTKEQGERYRERLRTIHDTKTSFGPDEYVWTTPQGEALTLLSTIFEIPSSYELPLFVCMDVDITEQKRAEEALRKSEERSRALFELTPGVCIQYYDLNGTILDWNPASERVFGFSPQQAIGKRLEDLIFTKEQGTQFRELLKSIYVSGTPQGPFEFPFLRADGTSGVCLSTVFQIPSPSDEPIFVCMDVDITERKQAEEEVRRSQEQYRLVMDQATDAIYVADENGIYVEINPTGCAQLGRSREEVIGSKVGSFATEKDRQRILEAFERAKAGEVVRSEWSLVRRDGSVFESEVSISRMSDGRIMGIRRDVTQRKLLEQQLLQAQKFESLGRLAGGIAHDFNNLLTAILGSAELASSAIDTDSRAQPYLAQIEEASSRAARLVQQLLGYAGRQALDIAVTDLNRVIASLREMFGRLIGEHIELQFELDESISAVNLDESKFEQVIVNLVLNARDAMRRGGRLTVRTFNYEGPTAEPNPLMQEAAGKYVGMSVADTGDGIPAGELGKIFDPFYSTKTSLGRTGLGLAVCQGAVSQVGGTILVESALGEGTTFTVLLPAIENGRENSEVSRKPSVSGGKEFLLVVEDDESVRTYVVEAIAALGYTVHPAESAEQALKLMHDLNGNIDLVFTDVIMPKTSGVAMMNVIWKVYPKVKALYTSGYPGEAFDSGPASVREELLIAKPFSIQALAERIRAAIDSPAVT